MCALFYVFIVFTIVVIIVLVSLSEEVGKTFYTVQLGELEEEVQF